MDLFYKQHRKDVLEKLNQILDLVKATNRSEVKNMATMDQILDDVTAEKTLVEGVSTLISSLKAEVAAIIPAGTLTADQQAKLDNIFAQAEANKSALATALGTVPTS